MTINSLRRRLLISAPVVFVLSSLLLVPDLAAQTPAAKSPSQKPQAPPQTTSGVSTGSQLTYTSRRTVGITDPKGQIVFEDVTAKTAMAAFRHRAGGAAKDYIFETPSGGVAIFDYDGDGLPDVYFVNGSTVLALQGKEKAPRAALYRNLGNWTGCRLHLYRVVRVCCRAPLDCSLRVS